MGLLSKARSADANYSLASWGWEAARWAFPGAVGGLMGWAAAYRDWIWNDYGMLGVMSVGLVAALIASVAFAMTGVGLRAWRGTAQPAVKEAPSPSQGSLTSNRFVLSKPPASTLIDPNRFYSREEKERIVDTMNIIQRDFTNAQNFVFEADKIAANPGLNEQIDKSIEKMREINEEVGKLNIDLDKIRNDSPNYPVDFAGLLAAKPVYSDEYERATYDYSIALTVYRHFLSDTGEHRGSLAQMVDAQKRHLSRAKYSFEKWIGECAENIRSARRALEK